MDMATTLRIGNVRSHSAGFEVNRLRPSKRELELQSFVSIRGSRLRNVVSNVSEKSDKQRVGAARAAVMQAPAIPMRSRKMMKLRYFFMLSENFRDGLN